MRTSKIENKKTGYISTKKQWIRKKTNRPIKKLEWTTVDSMGAVIGENIVIEEGSILVGGIHQISIKVGGGIQPIVVMNVIEKQDIELIE